MNRYMWTLFLRFFLFVYYFLHFYKQRFAHDLFYNLSDMRYKCFLVIFFCHVLAERKNWKQEITSRTTIKCEQEHFQLASVPLIATIKKKFDSLSAPKSSQQNILHALAAKRTSIHIAVPSYRTELGPQHDLPKYIIFMASFRTAIFPNSMHNEHTKVPNKCFLYCF